MKTLSKYILSLIFFIFLFLAVLAPVLSHYKVFEVSGPIYFLYQFLCHQRVWRSYHLFDYQIAFCAREVGLFSGLLISSIYVTYFKVPQKKFSTTFLILIASLIPIGLDGGIQAYSEILSSINNSIPLYESLNFIRSLTGVLTGILVGYSVVPAILENKESEFKFKKSTLINLSLIFIASLLFVSIINAASYFSSVKYRPSDIFWDVQYRYPGINYEITGNGGHTGVNNKRVLVEPNSRYCSLAEKYNEKIYDEYCK